MGIYADNWVKAQNDTRSTLIYLSVEHMEALRHLTYRLNAITYIHLERTLLTIGP